MKVPLTSLTGKRRSVISRIGIPAVSREKGGQPLMGVGENIVVPFSSLASFFPEAIENHAGIFD